MKKCAPIAPRVTPPYVIHCPRQWMGSDGERFALAMVFRQAGQICLADRMMPEKEPRRFRKRPRERGLAARRACGARAFPRRCPGAFDQTTRGHEVLDPREATHS